MPRNKQEDIAEENTTEMNDKGLTDDTSVAAKSDETTETPEDNSNAVDANAGTGESVAGESSLISSVFDTVTSVVGSVAGAVVEGAADLVNAVTGTETNEESSSNDENSASTVKTNKRAERIGIVQSDKMTKTVTVRVDRLIKHPMYRKYVKRHKKFMAHDELGSKAGDKVRIIETRPLSARKRWRVIEIVQKAEK